MMIAVIADKVSDRSAGNRGGKKICGVSGQIRGVEAAPGMTHDADTLRVNDPHLDDALGGGSDAIDDGDPWISRFEDDIRLEDEIAVTVHRAHVVIVALRRRAVAVKVVR